MHPEVHGQDIALILVLSSSSVNVGLVPTLIATSCFMVTLADLLSTFLGLLMPAKAYPSKLGFIQLKWTLFVYL